MDVYPDTPGGADLQARFLGQLPRRYEGAGGPNKLGAVLFTVDTDAGRCLSVTRVDRSDPLD